MSRRGIRAARAEEIRVPVPLLGTTWYDRGPAYWVRRAGITALMLIGLLTALLFAWGLITAAGESHPAAGAAVASVIGVTGLVSGLWLWRRSTPKAIEERARRTGRPSVDPHSARAASGLLGAAALAGNMLALAVVVIGGLLTLGIMVVVVLRSLGRQWPGERIERVLLNVPLGADDDRPGPVGDPGGGVGRAVRR